MSNAPTSAQTSFAHFRTEIEKLSKRMKMMEKDSADWKEKFEASSDQVKKHFLWIEFIEFKLFFNV